MFKKVKEKIDFLKWAYANRNIKGHEVNAYITVNNIKPELVCVERIVGNGELEQYEEYVYESMIKSFSKELYSHLSMEKEDLLNGTSKVRVRCYISPFVEDKNVY